METLPLTCTTCNQIITTTRIRYGGTGYLARNEIKNICGPCYTSLTDDERNNFQDAVTFEEGVFETLDYELFYGCFFKVMDYGIYPYTISSIPTHTCDEDYPPKGESEIEIVPAWQYDGDSCASIFLDPYDFETFLDYVSAYMAHEAVGKSILTKESCVEDAAHALSLVCQNGGVRPRLLTSAFTDLLASSLAQFTSPDFSGFPRSDIFTCLFNIFEGLDDSPDFNEEEEAEQGEEDGEETTFIQDWVKELSKKVGLISPSKDITVFTDSFAEEKDMKGKDLRLRISDTTEPSKSVILQIAPIRDGWNYVIQNHG